MQTCFLVCLFIKHLWHALSSECSLPTNNWLMCSVCVYKCACVHSCMRACMCSARKIVCVHACCRGACVCAWVCNAGLACLASCDLNCLKALLLFSSCDVSMSMEFMIKFYTECQAVFVIGLIVIYILSLVSLFSFLKYVHICHLRHYFSSDSSQNTCRSACTQCAF